MSETTPVDTFSQEFFCVDEIFSTPCAISSDIWRADRILDRKMRRIGLNESLKDQAQLRDVLGLIGSEEYAKRLNAGFDTQKTDLWVAAFGIRDGDRSSGNKAKRPGLPSGILQIDVDHYSDDKNALLGIQERLMALPYIIATFISPSKNGIKALAVLNKPRDFDHARAMGVACTKAVCDALDIVGYREGTTKNSASNYDLLPQEMKDKFGEAHIDFSVANDPRKGCFIPVQESNLLLKKTEVARFVNEDPSGSMTGWYYRGCTRPFARPNTVQTSTTVQATRVEIPFVMDVTPQVKGVGHRPDAYESRWQQYVQQAIEHSFEEFACAGPGAHHQAAITLGRTLKKYSPYLDNLEELFCRADNIISSWSPAASSPSTEKKTVRDMQAYADVISKEQWIEQKKAEDAVKQKETAAKQLETIITEKKFVDFDFDLQPDESLSWDQGAVAKLMTETFLAKYRRIENGCIDIHTCETSIKELYRAKLDRIWHYSDSKGGLKEITLKKSLALYGEHLGLTAITPVYRPDMKFGEIKDILPTPASKKTKTCINCVEGSPIIGLDLEKEATQQAREEAKIVANFCRDRFIDLENYPNPEEAKETAVRESTYYFKYISQALLEPLERYQCAIAMLSQKRGTGKSTLTLDIPTILGGGSATKIAQSVVSNPSALRFAWAQFEGVIFATFDDFVEPKDSIAASLRDIISTPVLSIEQKGVQAHQTWNFSRILVSSNSKEFLTELNSGQESERRWHLFSLKTQVRGNKECDAAMKIVKKYKKLVLDGAIKKNSADELRAFRAAMVLEFKNRVDAYESKHGKIDMEQAVDTAEFRTQKELGLGHNLIARTAGDIILKADGYKIKVRELYEEIKKQKDKTAPTERYIADKLKESGWFVIKIYDGVRKYTFTESGKNMFLPAVDQTEEIVDNLRDKPLDEQMAALNKLTEKNDILVTWKTPEVLDIQCVKSGSIFEDFKLNVGQPKNLVINFKPEIANKDYSELDDRDYGAF